jgi:hypothetical protein
MFERLIGWWRGLWMKPKAPVVVAAPSLLVVAEPKAVEVAEPKASCVNVQDATEEEEEEVWKLDFSFRETVLEDLDLYFRVLRRFKRADRESYDLYSQIGCYLVPETTMIDRQISPWFCRNKPTFGAVCVGNAKREAEAEERDQITPRFLYFQKYETGKAPPTVQRTNRGDVYVVTLYYDDLRGRLGLPFRLPIVLTGEGDVIPIKQLCYDDQRVRVKHSGGGMRRGEMLSIPNHRWRLPNFDNCRNPVEKITKLFVIAANLYEATAMGGITRVDVRQDEVHFSLSVDPKRTAGFFRDRKRTMVKSGTRSAPIFHSVRPHRRVVRGEERYIKMHFRGEREFEWNGYGVQISVPFREHGHAAQFNEGVIDVGPEDELFERGVGMKEVGQIFREVATADRRLQ